MKHLCLSLALLAGFGCDAAIVANAQPDPEPAPGVAAEAAAKAELTGKTVEAVVKANPDGQAKAGVAVKATLEPAAFDLESVTFLVKKGKVKDAKALEKQINNPKEKINNVDVDGDGKVDKIQVVEIRNEVEGSMVFELKAIPSTTKDKEAAIIIATINFVPDKVTKKLVVKAVYAPIIIGYDTIVYDYVVPIEVKGEAIVVVDSSPFYGWLFTVSRPVYYGVYIYEVAPPPVIVIEGGCWPPGHCKHHHGHKHKHKGKGKWH
jgi:hypothetical protein